MASGQARLPSGSSSLQPRNLLFLHYYPQSVLVTNRLKIQEPRLDVRDVLPLAKLDVLVTPLVAFDEDGSAGDGRRIL